MTINDIVKTARDLDDFIRICAGSLRKQDAIFEDVIRIVPEYVKNAVIRNWSIRQYRQEPILVLEVDKDYKTKTNESYKRKLRINEHIDIEDYIDVFERINGESINIYDFINGCFEEDFSVDEIVYYLTEYNNYDIETAYELVDTQYRHWLGE